VVLLSTTLVLHGSSATERSALDTLSETFVTTYFCPVCGIELEESDFDKPPDDYYCPFCSTQLPPSRARGRAGWSSPD
jgi:rubrerythrin